VPVIAIRLGEPAFDPSPQGLSHCSLLLSVCGPTWGISFDRVPLLSLGAQEGESGSEVKGGRPKGKSRSAETAGPD
jgi:hypothetical protein